MIKKQKLKNNNKFFYIVGFLTLLGLVLGLILVITGIDGGENTFLFVVLGIILMFVSFSAGSGIIIFRIARRMNFCEVCGERKMRILQKKGDTMYFKYECPRCHEKKEEYDLY